MIVVLGDNTLHNLIVKTILCYTNANDLPYAIDEYNAWLIVHLRAIFDGQSLLDLDDTSIIRRIHKLCDHIDDQLYRIGIISMDLHLHSIIINDDDAFVLFEVYDGHS